MFLKRLPALPHTRQWGLFAAFLTIDEGGHSETAIEGEFANHALCHSAWRRMLPAVAAPATVPAAVSARQGKRRRERGSERRICLHSARSITLLSDVEGRGGRRRAGEAEGGRQAAAGARRGRRNTLERRHSAIRNVCGVARPQSLHLQTCSSFSSALPALALVGLRSLPLHLRRMGEQSRSVRVRRARPSVRPSVRPSGYE